jgi:hypothetical protein
MQLADIQAGIANGLVRQTRPLRDALLTGGEDPSRRFAVHSRHYAASLARSILDRFTATVWLTGSAPMATAAFAFVSDHPPASPCIAEYGENFPAYLGTRADLAHLPYLAQFATIDWHLGRLAIAISCDAIDSLAQCDPQRIADAQLRLQPGLEFLEVDWSLDELVAFYLSGELPNRYALRREAVWLELRGARGDLSLQRLSSGDFTFRKALAEGATLGDAATAAHDTDQTFTPQAAVSRLLQERLVTAVVLPQREAR